MGVVVSVFQKVHPVCHQQSGDRGKDQPIIVLWVGLRGMPTIQGAESSRTERFGRLREIRVKEKSIDTLLKGF